MSVHCPETLRRYNHYRKKDDLIVIKYSTQWCGPCKAIMPRFKELAKKYRNVYFLDVDIENKELLNHEDLNNIRSVPTFKFFINKEVKRYFSGVDMERLIRYVEKLV